MIFGHIHESNYNPNPRVKGGLRFYRVFPSVNRIKYAPAILQQFCEKAIKKYNQENKEEEEEGNTYIFAELEEAFVRSSHVRDNIVIYFKACQMDGTTTTFRANTHSASKKISAVIPFGPDPDIDINVTPWSSTDKPESPIAGQRNCGGPRLVA